MNKIRDIRRSKYLTLQQVSNITKLSVSTISAAERGISNPTIKTLTLISKVLNVSIQELLDK